MYQLSIVRRAQKELAKLPSEDYGRVKQALFALGDEPRPRSCKKLSGREGWRIRVGRYRVIYEIDDGAERVTVLHRTSERCLPKSLNHHADYPGVTFGRPFSFSDEARTKIRKKAVRCHADFAVYKHRTVKVLNS